MATQPTRDQSPRFKVKTTAEVEDTTDGTTYSLAVSGTATSHTSVADFIQGQAARVCAETYLRNINDDYEDDQDD